jgi:hypothetical protein
VPSRHRRKMAGVVILASCSIIAAGVAWAATSRAGSPAVHACFAPKTTVVAKGRNGAGHPWVIGSQLSGDNSCRSWFLRASFSPFGRAGNSWRGGTEIPIHGSISRKFPIAAQDLSGPTGRAFSGITGSGVMSVEARTRGGRLIVITPARPSPAVVRRAPWLRNLRYFMRYLPTQEIVEFVQVRGAGGSILFKGRGAFGSFGEP